MFQKIINNKIIVIFITPLLLGLTTVFSFQPFNVSFINFIVLPLLFTILCYVNKRSKNIYRKKPYLINLFFIGYFFGIGFFLAGNFWISHSLTFDDRFEFLIPFAVILIPLTLGLFFGLAFVSIGPFVKNNFSSLILFIISLSIADFLRGKILTGFPWNLWSYSLSWCTELLQILNPIGLYAFNLLVISLYVIPICIFFKNRHKYLVFFSIISIFFSFYIFGSYLINKNDLLKEKTIDKVNVKVISPNFKLKFNLSDEEIEKSITQLIRFSDPNKDKKTLFIWPEGVFTGVYFDELTKYKHIVKEKFSSKHILIFGVNTRGENSSEFYNSLVAVNNKFEIIYRYNKKKLVPFGEFLPFEHFLNLFGLKKITQGFGSFSAGSDQPNMIVDKAEILPLICYEIIFPEILQNYKKNTNLIINISEDGWFGNTIGPFQHFIKAKYRAIENNVFLIRSANKGISAFIDNKGNVIKALSSTEAGSIELDVPILNTKTKNKNDFIFFILLITYTFIFLLLRKYEKK